MTSQNLAERINLDEIYNTIADVEPIKEPRMNKVPHSIAPANVDAAGSNPQLTIIADAIKRAEKLFATKNAEYGDKADILSNFRRLASQQSVPMSTAWFFLAGKHIDTITQYVKDVRENKTRARSEPIRDRIDDMVVYSLLLLAIVAEENR
jgi:hypothetical protein